MASANTHVLVNLAATLLLAILLLLMLWLWLPAGFLVRCLATPFLLFAALYLGHKFLPRLTNSFLEK